MRSIQTHKLFKNKLGLDGGSAYSNNVTFPHCLLQMKRYKPGERVCMGVTHVIKYTLWFCHRVWKLGRLFLAGCPPPRFSLWNLWSSFALPEGGGGVWANQMMMAGLIGFFAGRLILAKEKMAFQLRFTMLQAWKREAIYQFLCSDANWCECRR